MTQNPIIPNDDPDEILRKVELEREQERRAVIDGWALLLEIRDRETSGHSQRVIELAVALAEKAGLPSAEVEGIRRGALLHDIGKIGIPDSILWKPGPLSDDEWRVMRRHTLIGYRALKSIPFLHDALDIVLYHHERWDGSGYPEGLQGEAIPISARLYAIVGVWDSLRSDQPYRPGWTDEQARQYLMAQAGCHFDPQLVQLFLEMLDQAS